MTKRREKQPPREDEVRSLNAADLDVEELERRLELATLAAAAEDCYSFRCGTYTPPPT